MVGLRFLGAALYLTKAQFVPGLLRSVQGLSDMFIRGNMIEYLTVLCEEHSIIRYSPLKFPIL